MKLAAAAMLVVFAVPLVAQTADTPPPPPPAPGMHRGPGGPGFAHEGMRTVAAPVTSAPLTAKYVSSSSFTTRDGKSVQRDGSAALYRDSLGRTRQDFTVPPPPPRTPNGAASTATPPAPASPHTMTVILDPVANTVTRLLSDRKVAIVETVTPDFFKHAIDREAREAAGATPPDRKASVTSLGSETFAGVSATGNRTTRTFQPHDGDTTAAAKTETHDAWFSPDLKIEVSSTETGGHGTTTRTLTALTRAEPDAALFKVPANYTVKTATPHEHHGRGPGGADAPPPPPAM